MLSRFVCPAIACAVAASLLAVAAAPGQSQRPTREDQLRATQLLSRTPSGQAPNAPAGEPVLSQDERVSRYAAYVSAATDIVSGSGAARNVYLVRRARPWGQNGTAWRFGSTELVSRGPGGEPADGDSWGPILSGSDYVRPRCMAFVSAASNLASGDTNGRADVFFRRLPSGSLTRLPASGPVTQVSVDGLCKHVAFVAAGRLYVNKLGEGTRRIPGSGVTNPHLAVDGRAVTFERSGWIHARTLKSGGTRRVAQGSNHTSDFYSRYVAFVRGDSILRADVEGSPNVRAVQRAGIGAVVGRDPVMTAGGGWIWYADGVNLSANIRKRDQGRCPAGEVHAPDTSPHGNYAVFLCTDGPAYLLYEGPQFASTSTSR